MSKAAAGKTKPGGDVPPRQNRRRPACSRCCSLENAAATYGGTPHTAQQAKAGTVTIHGTRSYRGDSGTCGPAVQPIVTASCPLPNVGFNFGL
jgi:hypothetical protein